MTETVPSTALAAPSAPPQSSMMAGLITAMQTATGMGKEGLEVLQGLHAMAKEERAWTARQASNAAMVGFRREMPAIRKSVPGQHGATHKGTRTTGLYAPLDTITPILDPIALKHGFTYYFTRGKVDGVDSVICHVVHEGGHEFTSSFPCPPDVGGGKTVIQTNGSSETYARRYALTAAFALTVFDPIDGDGEAPINAGPPVDANQAANVRAMFDDSPKPDEWRRRFLGWVGVKTFEELPAGRLAELVAKVDAMRKKGWK